jgi:hypothetical protein
MFNDWHGNKTFIQGSEMSGDRNTRASADQMKTIIAGDMISINQKHQPLYTPRTSPTFISQAITKTLYSSANTRDVSECCM